MLCDSLSLKAGDQVEARWIIDVSKVGTWIDFHCMKGKFLGFCLCEGSTAIALEVLSYVIEVDAINAPPPKNMTTFIGTLYVVPIHKARIYKVPGLLPPPDKELHKKGLLNGIFCY